MAYRLLSTFHVWSLRRKCIAQTATKSYNLNRLYESQQRAMTEGPTIDLVVSAEDNEIEVVLEEEEQKKSNARGMI